MSRPRKTTAELEASGAWKHDPNRRRPDDIPPVLGKFKKPISMNPFDEMVWDELLPMLPPGIENGSDSILFEALVTLVRKMRTMHAAAGDLKMMRELLNKFGLTPQGRAAISPNPMFEPWEGPTVTQAKYDHAIKFRDFYKKLAREAGAFGTPAPTVSPEIAAGDDAPFRIAIDPVTAGESE